MPAKDKYHTDVTVALEKAGWAVEEPFVIKFDEVTLYADLIANKESVYIIVEIKTMDKTSTTMMELERAIGQYILYRFLVRRKFPDRQIYLAIPEKEYQRIFKPMSLAVEFKQTEKLLIMTFDPDQQEVVQWNA